MKRKEISFFIIFCFCLTVLWTNVESLHGQEVRLQFNNAVKRQAPRRTSRPAATQRVIVQTREIVRKEVVPTSNLTVATEDGAKVTLRSAALKKQPPERTVPRGSGSVVFEDLPPGKYTVSASLEGFNTKQTDITITPRKTVGIDLELEPIKYQLNIETNISEGEVRYAPARLKEKRPDGSLVTEETAGVCFVPIKAGKAVIRDMREGDGYYNIDVRPAPNQSEFEPKLTAIKVSEEAFPQDNAAQGEKESVEITLDLKLSTQQFSAAWSQNEWLMPQQNWSVKDGKMKVEGIGIALPFSEVNRNFKDFEMISNVRSLDGKNVGFALRARDKNYYLIQLSGKNAADPYRFSFYVVKNDVPTLITGASIEQFAQTIDNKRSFEVIVKGTNNLFKVSLKDSRTGSIYPLGNVEDPNGNFRKGAIGVALRDNSNFEVGSFIICPSACN